MEDITSTASLFSKDELTAMCRHIVMVHVTKILDIKKSIDESIHDSDLPKSVIHTQVRERLSRMTSLWGDLGPAKVIARRLYCNTDHHLIFDVLDKSLSVEMIYDDLKSGKNIVLDRPCSLRCCI